jgi:hypothetical protein
MTAILSFNDWTARFTDAEYALFRTRMRGVTFIGGNLTRRWDQAIAQNWIDLDDPIMSSFKQALIDEGILVQARADAVFDPTGASTTPPDASAGPPGPAGADGADGLDGAPGPAGTSMVTGAGAPTQDMPAGTIYLDSITGDLYQFT